MTDSRGWMWVVIDHLRGHRRGQRQEVEIDTRVTIGRHPDCAVSFDTRRDLEASTRHAELRTSGEELLLVDVGSSNGTYVAEERISECSLPAGEATEVEFGARGPRLRIWWHPTADPSAGPPLPPSGLSPRGIAIIGGGVLFGLLLVLLIALKLS